MRKLLKKLYIVQEVSNELRHEQGLPRLGKGYFNAYRFNPYNPLSYIALILIFTRLKSFNHKMYTRFCN